MQSGRNPNAIGLAKRKFSSLYFKSPVPSVLDRDAHLIELKKDAEQADKTVEIADEQVGE